MVRDVVTKLLLRTWEPFLQHTLIKSCAILCVKTFCVFSNLCKQVSFFSCRHIVEECLSELSVRYGIELSIVLFVQADWHVNQILLLCSTKILRIGVMRLCLNVVEESAKNIIGVIESACSNSMHDFVKFEVTFVKHVADRGLTCLTDRFVVDEDAVSADSVVSVLLNRQVRDRMVYGESLRDCGDTISLATLCGDCVAGLKLMRVDPAAGKLIPLILSG